MASESQIVNWVEKSIEKLDLKNYKINITGRSEKDEGYVGDIIFVEVEGACEENKSSILHLVVKHAKINEHMRKAMPVDIIFENEIYMYSTVIPAFQRFQKDRGVDNVFNCIAKCYYSSSSEDTEVLILENLKVAGFQNYDRKKPMDSTHCKAILQQLGRFHAVSFALRDQNKDEFTALTTNIQDPMKWFMNDPATVSSMKKSQEFVSALLKKKGDLELYDKLEKLWKSLDTEVNDDFFTDDEPQNVINHGDPWCNNFMFKYEGLDKNNPSEVAILDWQMSATRSPVFDLSYFFYAVCSKTELESFEELLKFYYDTFAEHLVELGSDPEVLFQYSDLKIHWKKYSIYGVLTACTGLKIFLCDKKNAPDLGSIEEGTHFMELFTDVPLDEVPFYERIKPVIWHYFDFIEKNYKTMATYTQVECWAEKFLVSENLKNYKVVIRGGTEKGEGFLGDILFVEVEGTTQNDVPKRLYFVVKHAKPSENFRKTIPVDLIFENEILLYTAVIPAFQKFQQEKQITDSFDCVAKCFYSSTSGNIEVLVLENLKKKGYQHYDRKQPMNLNHCKAILKQYGKLHALSFAMRHQKKEIFDDLASKLHDTPGKILGTDLVGKVLDDSRDVILEMFRKNGDGVLHEKLAKLLERGPQVMMMEALNAEESQSVEDSKDKPSAVALIDFQLSTLRSPVFDLSYFLYAVCSKTQLERFEELLHFYYNSLAEHLKELGSDPEEIFSYSDLKSHWRKYSIFGLVNVSIGLRIFLCDEETAPSLEDVGDENTFVDIFKNIKFEDDTLFYDRIKGVVWHYFHFLDNK
nr:uncharacterized protein LOC111502934 [Leptinotarsa decemlineata]